VAGRGGKASTPPKDEKLPVPRAKGNTMSKRTDVVARLYASRECSR
jgi:hypothetical protein